MGLLVMHPTCAISTIATYTAPSNVLSNTTHEPTDGPPEREHRDGLHGPKLRFGPRAARLTAPLVVIRAHDNTARRRVEWTMLRYTLWSVKQKKSIHKFVQDD